MLGIWLGTKHHPGCAKWLRLGRYHSQYHDDGRVEKQGIIDNGKSNELRKKTTSLGYSRIETS